MFDDIPRPTCRSVYTAYVQKGENDICDDGKEIAEAEDWESTVKENRSSLHPCLIHLISLHIFSTVISSCMEVPQYSRKGHSK
eukprot:Em0080g7a